MKLLFLAVIVAQVSGGVDPLALQRMAATERAFAAATAMTARIPTVTWAIHDASCCNTSSIERAGNGSMR